MIFSSNPTPHPLSEPSLWKRYVLPFPLHTIHSSSWTAFCTHHSPDWSGRGHQCLPAAGSSVQCLVLILLDLCKAFHSVALLLFHKPFLPLNFKRQHAPGLPPISGCTSYFPTEDLSSSPSPSGAHSSHPWAVYSSHSSMASKRCQLPYLFFAQTALLSLRPVYPTACLLSPRS